MELTINIDDAKFERVKTAYSDWFTAQGTPTIAVDHLNIVVTMVGGT